MMSRSSDLPVPLLGGGSPSTYGATADTGEAHRYDDAADDKWPLEVVEEEAKPKQEEPVSTLTFTCFVCISLAAFLGDASRGLVTPSIVPYVTAAGGTASFVGWVNGLYSIGRLFAAPLFGWWAERRTYREAILANLLLYVIGNTIYALAGTNKWIILFSRLVAGLGSGTLGLSRGYVAQTTTNRDRSGYMAWLTAAQFIGYSVTPGPGALFSFVDITIIGSLAINAYTAPGYLLALGGIVNAVLMILTWIEPPRQEKEDLTQVQLEKEEEERASCWSIVSPAIVLFVVLMFMTRFVVATYETAGQLLATELFQWSIFEFGLIACVFGVVGTVVLFLQKPAARYILDEWVLVAGLAALSLGLFVFPPLSWFSGLRALWIAQYDLGSVLIFGLGYPISQALLLSFFSKALGPIPQSTIMGMMASLGSTAKVIGALAAGWAHQRGWLNLCFYIPGVVLSLSTGLTAFYFRTKQKGKRQ